VKKCFGSLTGPSLKIKKTIIKTTIKKIDKTRKMSPLSPARLKIRLLILGVLTALGGLVFPLLGRNCFSPSIYWSGLNGSAVSAPDTVLTAPDTVSVQERIFFQERLPKTGTALLAGAGLAMAGLMMQVLFRNPLASPYTLGTASGAAFGAVVWLNFAPAVSGLRLGFSPAVWASFAGALLATGLVYLLFRLRNLSPDQMLLAGIAVNFFFSSLILAVQYSADPGRSFRMIRWTMGRIEALDAGWFAPLLGLVLAAGLILFLFSREMDILLTGRDRALSLGVSVDRYRTGLFLLASILVGAIVAVCGPIGFIGLMVPHLGRMLFGPEHRYLIPASALLGGLMLAGCFTVSRTILDGDILPVGIITSLFGGPFFLGLLLRKR